MTVTNGQASVGMKATVTVNSPNAKGTVTIGAESKPVALPGAALTYSFLALLAPGAGAIWDAVTGEVTPGVAWSAGTAQVETATAAGTITQAGNASVTVTAAGMTGSPKTLAVPVALNDTAATWAGKVRAALAKDAAVSAMFAISGAGTAIVLTRKPIVTAKLTSGDYSIFPGNDGMLVVALDNGTCTGITPAANSANTTAGVATTGGIIDGGAGYDVAGVILPEAEEILGLFVDLQSNATVEQVCSASCGLASRPEMGPGTYPDVMPAGMPLPLAGLTVTFTCESAAGKYALLSVTVVGK